MREVGSGSSPRVARHPFAIVVCAAAVLLSLTVGGVGAGASAPVPSQRADMALDWLAGRMAANGGTVPGFGPGSTDWGLTADAILALVAAGRSSTPVATTATDRLAANVAAFTTWTANGATARDAGATAKALLALRSTGRPSIAGGVDLESELRSLMVATGPETGRFSDRVPDPSWNAANGFGQAMAILGLRLTANGAPPEAVTFLLAQQCPGGGFRLSYTTVGGCTSDSQADTDGTAVSLQALLAVERTPTVLAALQRGAAWLVSRQGADGSFGGTGPTAGANTNSSGLIAQFLRAAGRTTEADRASTWITSCCQLTSANAPGTPASGDVGALAYNPAALSSALTGGITAGAGDQWYRTNTQAVLALGLAPYGARPVEPLPPVDPSTPTSEPTTSVPTSTVPTTSAPDGTPATTTTSTANPAGTQDAQTAVPPEAQGTSSGATDPQQSATVAAVHVDAAQPSRAGLASTGTEALQRAGLGLVLLAIGTLVSAATRRRKV